MRQLHAERREVQARFAKPPPVYDLGENLRHNGLNVLACLLGHVPWHEAERHQVAGECVPVLHRQVRDELDERNFL
eukprot:366226-Chlamydomonas_euryale.AAC.5